MLLRTYVLFGLAAAGFGFGIYMSYRTNAAVPVSQPVADPASSPFVDTIAGAGIIEARSENLAIGTPVSGIVTSVRCAVGQEVAAGDALFEIDGRSLRADLTAKRAALASAEAKIKRLKAMPRAEDVVPARARVAAATATLDDAQSLYTTASKVTIPGAVSPEEINRRRQLVEVAKARLAEASAELALLEAGAWNLDIDVAAADAAMAKAEVERVEVELERLVVRAPVRGTVLKVNIRPGEFAPSEALANPLLVLGDTQYFHVRVDIDESDIWRIQGNPAAICMLRGNSQLSARVEFVRVEPYVIPKRSLTGDSSERVDTRVLQLLYRLGRGSLPVQVGQQVDVFLEIPPKPGAESAPRGSAVPASSVRDSSAPNAQK